MQERTFENEIEWELINTLRNYRRGYPNTKFLDYEVKRLVDLLKDPSIDY